MTHAGDRFKARMLKAGERDKTPHSRCLMTTGTRMIGSVRWNELCRLPRGHLGPCEGPIR